MKIFERFGKNRKKDEAAAKNEEEIARSAETSAEEDAQSDHEEDMLLPPMDDELLTLWRMWAGEAPPPRISLLGKDAERELPLSDSEITAEKLRLMCSIANDTKQRYARVTAAEEEGITPSLDAECCCYISKNAMVAWIYTFPPVGEGRKLQASEIGMAMQRCDVKDGLISSAIMQIMSDGFFKLIPVAFGVPAVEGIDGSVTELYPREVEHEVKMNEDGTADYRTQNYVQVVQKGDILCDITLPTPGTAGKRVTGEELQPRKVNVARVPRGKNTQFTEDGLHLYANETGHLEYFNGAFHVMKVLDVDGDVDYSCGNIDYPGDVHITGDVRSGFKVKAEGSVMVEGLVESADIEAGTDIIITKGVVGDERAVLRAGGSIRTKYLENCKAYAQKDLYADCVFACDVFCDDTISAETGRGSIVGGNLTAARAVKAYVIGARSGRTTNIVLGVATYQNGEIAKIRSELKDLDKAKAAADEEIERLKRLPQTPENTNRIAKAKLQRSALDIKEGRHASTLDRLLKEKPDLSRCRVTCGMIYPITKITVEGDTRTVENQSRDYKLHYNEESKKLEEYSIPTRG